MWTCPRGGSPSIRPLPQVEKGISRLDEAVQPKAMGRTLQDQKLMAQGQISTCKAARESSEFRREENNTQKIINMEGDSLQTRTGKVNRVNQNGVFTKHSVNSAANR